MLYNEKQVLFGLGLLFENQMCSQNLAKVSGYFDFNCHFSVFNNYVKQNVVLTSIEHEINTLDDILLLGEKNLLDEV